MSERDLLDELLKARVKTKLFGGDHAPRLGRLVILEPLGSGGMGAVFAAYDPRLDRKVAVKLLREEGENAARVLREARALGKLAHPNVVAVYDATENDGVVSIVMELAPGESLRAWIGGDKTWRELLDVFLQIGAGLSAAHHAGIVHRDIKPDNIVIGPDRARLVDFGLARASDTKETDPETTDLDPDRVDSLEGSGTPSYMAPEVVAGSPANEASDQFSFGVTLYEALYGKRPDSGEAKAPAGSSVPSWLHAIVVRTLAADPKARFSSIDAVIAELGRDRRRRRQALLGGVGVVALALTVGFFGYRRGALRDVCGGGKERARSLNADGLRASMGDAPWAKKAVDDFVELAHTWEKSHRRVCEATRVHGSQSESSLELRMRCLDRRFERMAALSGALSGTLDGDARENASGAIAALPRPERCETLVDPGELALPDDPARRARVQTAERDLDRAWTEYALGRYRQAGELAVGIEAAARELAFPPLNASLSFLLGSIAARLGDASKARVRLEAALRDAATAHAVGLEADIWARLMRNELFDGNRTHVIEWAPFARAASSRAGLSGAEIDGILGEALRDAGELGPARERLNAALSSGDELRGDQRALVEMNLGSIELAFGKPAAAEAAFGRAFGLAETALGQGHPGLGLYLDKLAAASRDRGRLAEALTRHDRALELRRLVYGENDRAVATTLLRRAQTRIEAGKIAAAEADLLRAREIRVGVHGANHRRLGEVDVTLGDTYLARGDRVQARTMYERAESLDDQLRLMTRFAEVGSKVESAAIGPLMGPVELTLDRAELSALRVDRLLQEGNREEAEREAERLLARFRALGSGVGSAIANRVARAQQRVGKREEASKIFEAALGELADEPSRERLRSLLGLAESAEPERARRAASDALRLLEAMPELAREKKADLQRVLDSRGLGR